MDSVAAFSGLVGVFLGALLQQSRERRQWLRNERLRAYSAFYGGIKAYLRAGDALFTAATAEPLDEKVQEEAVRCFQAAGRDLDEAARLVELIGSPTLRELASTVTDESTNLAWECANAGWKCGFPLRWDSPNETGIHEGACFLFVNAIDEIVATARTELGNAPRSVARIWQGAVAWAKRVGAGHSAAR